MSDPTDPTELDKGVKAAELLSPAALLAAAQETYALNHACRVCGGAAVTVDRKGYIHAGCR